MHGQNGLFVQLLCGRSFTKLSVCEDNMNLTFAEIPVCLTSEERPDYSTSLMQRHTHTYKYLCENPQSLRFHIAALAFDMPGLLCIFDK